MGGAGSVRFAWAIWFYPLNDVNSSVVLSTSYRWKPTCTARQLFTNAKIFLSGYLSPLIVCVLRSLRVVRAYSCLHAEGME